MFRSHSRTRAFPWLLSGLLSCFTLADAGTAQYAVVSQNTQLQPLAFGSLQLTDTVVQEGANPLNRFTMHRVQRAGAGTRGVLLLLPPLGNRFEQYLVHESGDPSWSFAGFFARIGYDVWGYSPRSANVAAGACFGGVDCSAALGWTLQTVLDDVAYIRTQIAAAQPGCLPVVGGLSMGATTGLAVVDASPNDYAGVLAWEGAVTTTDVAVQTHALGFYQQLDAMLAAGIAFEDQSLPLVKQVGQLATIAPNDPFALPVPGFPPGLTNMQAFVAVMSVPNPLAPSPRPGFISAVGDVPAGELVYSDEERLLANVAVFNDSISIGILRDLYGGLAGVVPQYGDNLAAFTGKVLVIKAGLGFGSVMDELPAQLSSADVTFQSIEQFAHVDHFGSSQHWWLLELPIALWLETVF